MRERTKKHPTRKSVKSSSKRSDPIKADDYFKEVYGNMPEGAVYLSGLRYREDLTQKELGELIGVAQSNISLMEKGLRPIGKNIAKRLAEVFKTDYRLFL